jgi:hypothetical protein
MDPLTLSLLISAGASILSGFLGSNAASQASSTEAHAIDRATDLQAATIAQARVDAAPWMEAGKKGLAALQGELGLTNKNADGTPFVSGFKTTPGYNFAVSEGEKGVVNNMRALGMGGSGAALKALTRFRTGLADQTYQGYIDRLSGVATGGQSQVNNTNALAAAGTQGIAQQMQDAGAARASGYVGGANAWTGALGNFANSSGAALGNYNRDWTRIVA